MSKPWSWLTTEIYEHYSDYCEKTFERKLTTLNNRVFYIYIESKKVFLNYLLLNFYLINDPFDVEVKTFDQYFVNSQAELFFVIDTKVSQLWQLDLLNQPILETKSIDFSQTTPTNCQEYQSIITPEELQELLKTMD
jgi:hypothetical protein